MWRNLVIIISIILATCVLSMVGTCVYLFCKRPPHGYQNLAQNPHFKNVFVEQDKELFQVRGEEIKLGQRIGKGSYGDVFQAQWRGIVVAVKKLPYQQQSNPEFLEDFLKEAGILSSLRHPHILMYLGSCFLDGDLCIVTEFMAMGSVYKLLRDEKFAIDYDLIKRFATDTASGMIYLHHCKPVILHRDLKSHNLLVDQNLNVKISDFGLSKVLESKTKTMTSCGTAAWAAPEILKNAHYTEKADVYSYGICLWEFFTRKEVYEGMPAFQIIFAVGTEGLRPQIPESCPKDYSHLITNCWDQNPNNRPAFDEILNRLNLLE